MINSALSLSQKYGLSVVPVGSDKRPTIKWGAFQKSRMTADEVREMFTDSVRMGVVCGNVSGGLEVLDFDIEGFFPRWEEVLSDNGYDDLLEKLVVVRTPSGGRHVYYRCSNGERNQKLAMVYGKDGRPEVAIETRGEGGYVVAYPSEGYTMCRGKLSAVPTISDEDRNALVHAARILSEVADEPVSKVQAFSAAGRRPGDEFNASASWSSILEPHGWRLVGRLGDRERWCRPGKSGRHTSATTGNGHGKDLLKVFTSNAHPFAVDGVYSKFFAYTLLNHGGDLSAAASSLARDGYGEQSFSAAGTTSTYQTDAEPSEAGTVGGFLSHRLRWSQLRELPPKPMLVDKILGVGDSAMIVGLRKGGKTAVTFDLLLAMMAGGKFAGKFQVLRPLTVAYFTTEGTGSIHIRMASANVGHNVPDDVLEDSLVYVPRLPQLFDGESETAILSVAREIRDAGIPLDVMVLDTFAKAINGAEENSNSDMSKALSTLQQAREILGCATILLHHVNKGGTIRGASAIDGDLDVLLNVEWDEETNDRRLAFGFAKDLGPFDAIPFELDVMDPDVPGSIRVNWTPGRMNKGMSTIDRILAVMRQDQGNVWSLGQLASLLPDVRNNTLQTAMARESDKGLASRISIIKVDDKPLRYRLSEKGVW